MYHWGSSLSFITIFDEGIFEREKNSSERFFGQLLPSVRMVIECAFGQLKAIFGCLRREKAINLKDFPAVISSCFLLHNCFVFFIPLIFILDISLGRVSILRDLLMIKAGWAKRGLILLMIRCLQGGKVS